MRVCEEITRSDYKARGAVAENSERKEGMVDMEELTSSSPFTARVPHKGTPHSTVSRRLHGVGWCHRDGSERPSEKLIKQEGIKMFRWAFLPALKDEASSLQGG